MQDNPRVDQELEGLARPQAHPENLYVRQGYAPASRYPSADFTAWISAKLLSRQFDDIGYLLSRITEANPGIGVGASYWRSIAADLCGMDLHRTFRFDDERAYLDLHAASIAYALHESLSGFMLSSGDVRYLARAVSPYSFEVVDLDTRVSAANAFIKEMRRKTKGLSYAWTDFPLLKKDSLVRGFAGGPPAPALREVLKRASIGARQMFFGTLEQGPGQGGWDARKFGINENVAAAELVNLGLGRLDADPHLVLMTFKKDELLSALAGHPTKQGWSKKYLIKYMNEHAPHTADSLAAGRSVLDLNQDAKASGAELLSWVSRITPVMAVAMAFR